MGVKSTVFISREVAEDRWVEFRLSRYRSEWKALSKLVSDQRLEDELEDLNDDEKGGEGFENYVIEDRRPL